MSYTKVGPRLLSRIDFGLPGIDGYSLVQQCLATGRCKGQRKIALTSDMRGVYRLGKRIEKPAAKSLSQSSTLGQWAAGARVQLQTLVDAIRDDLLGQRVPVTRRAL